MNAHDTIQKIKSATTTFMGHTCQRVATTLQTRDELQSMMSRGDITPATYWQALAITWPQMDAGEKRSEADALNR